MEVDGGGSGGLKLDVCHPHFRGADSHIPVAQPHAIHPTPPRIRHRQPQLRMRWLLFSSPALLSFTSSYSPASRLPYLSPLVDSILTLGLAFFILHVARLTILLTSPATNWSDASAPTCQPCSASKRNTCCSHNTLHTPTRLIWRR